MTVPGTRVRRIDPWTALAAGCGALAALLVPFTDPTAAAEPVRSHAVPAGTSPPPPPPPRPGAAPPPEPAPASGTAAAVPGPVGTSANVDPRSCLERIAKLGVVLQPLPPMVDGACGAKHPFKLSGLPGGVVATPGGEVGCPVAEALARWVTEVVGPEARTHLDLAPRALLIGATYVCRGRNRVAAAQLSEHAFANAVDIMGFTFEKGPPLLVKDRGDDSPEGRFQAAVRARACAYFTTVLGPRTDATHADHLHFDLRVRKGDFRICQ